MSDYIITENGLLPADELMHYAKGQTKKNAKYKSRKMVNGHWVYDYGRKATNTAKAAKNYQKLADEANQDAHNGPVKTTWFTPDGTETGYDYSYAKKRGKQAGTYHKMANKQYSMSESYKRMQQSAIAAGQRKASNKNIFSKIRSKKSYYVSKAKNFLKKYGLRLN